MSIDFIFFIRCLTSFHNTVTLAKSIEFEAFLFLVNSRISNVKTMMKTSMNLMPYVWQ